MSLNFINDDVQLSVGEVVLGTQEYITFNNLGRRQTPMAATFLSLSIPFCCCVGLPY